METFRNRGCTDLGGHCASCCLEVQFWGKDKEGQMMLKREEGYSTVQARVGT